MLKRKKRQLSYVDAHNKAVNLYKKSASALIWAGIFNVVGSIFFTVSGSNDLTNFLGAFLCFGTNTFIFSLPSTYSFLLSYLPWSAILYIAISFALSAIYCMLGFFSLNGNKKFLYSGIGLYFVDWIMLIMCYFFETPGVSNDSLYLLLGVHLVITIFLLIALYQRYKVIELEKKRKELINKETNN
ncbi:MAG: hypothetical protein ACI31G_01625 [Bacilli bacterium]